MIVRAYDDTDPRIQEEVLKKTLGLTKHLDSQVRGPILCIPRVVISYNYAVYYFCASHIFN